jgi:ABC-type branched-subunit amino acid transport system substrate-binding protein
MVSDGAQRIAVVHTAVEYEAAFATGVSTRLQESVRPIAASETIAAETSNFTGAINAIVAAAPDAIVLAADASTASRFVNQFAIVAGPTGIRWYLSPTLEQQGFVLNSFPDVVEGMVGVAAAVSNDTARIQAFADTFVRRWTGSTPTTGAYFYYDTLALFAVAFEGAASVSASAAPPSQALHDEMLSASGMSGLVVEWNEVQKGITEASHGTAVYYSGITGVISLDHSGARSAAYTRFWTITAGQLAPLSSP